jgi:GTPase involved in cell partitioning and DNA repair
LIHVVDVNSVDPVSDYICIRTELERYSAPLTQKPELVVLNKIDKGMVRYSAV